MQQPSQFCSEYHKRRHPTEIVTKYPFPIQNSRHKNQYHDAIINNITLPAGDGYAVLCFKKEVQFQTNVMITIIIRITIAKNNYGNPNDSYNIFYTISPSLSRMVAINRKSALL